MAENSNNPKNLNMQNKGELNNKARSSSPSFDPRKNQFRPNNNAIGDVQKQIKRKAITEGVKKGAQAFGVPEAATEAVLNTETGKEAMDAAVDAPSVREGTLDVVKIFSKKQLIKILPAILAPFILIILMISLVSSKDAFGGLGGGTDEYEDLRKEIAKTISNYSNMTDVDGTLILATLIGYSDVNELDNPTNSHSIAQMKKQVSKLASFQVMTTKSCDYDSSSIRQIASNDDLIGEANYKCVPDMEGETYSLSIEEGKFNDDNSGSVYFWNLIDEDFIFNYYNDYMINPNNNTSENDEKIIEIISEIYAYYESLKEASDGNDYFSNYITGSGYWWPVGSLATTEENGKTFAKGEPYAMTITATFSGDDSVHKGSHGALDISGYDVYNKANIIATKAGTVVYPVNRSQVQFGDGSLDIPPSYGNYVIIDHGDGIFSLYGHMYKDSITVFAGDVVEQGQVIGKMGTSGRSSGAHLHFEIRNGGNASDFKVDPLLYVDPSNPRPTGSAFTEWIKQIEGGTSGKYVDGDNYVVYDGSDGVLTVGYGIVIVNKNGDQLYKNIYDTPVTVGSRIPMNIVDKMFDQFMASTRMTLATTKAINNISLSSSQDDAILSLMYNCGSQMGVKTLNAYGENNDSTALWNVMSTCKGAQMNGVYKELHGLKVRRAEEYELFMKGDYRYDPLSYAEGSPVKYYDVSSW